MVKVSVKDFGPIIEGAVELKPLTIFVGPNNAGKSYMAMLMYALFHSSPLGEYFDIPRFLPRSLRSDLLRVRIGLRQKQEDVDVSEFSAWLESHSDEVLDKSGLQFSSLPRKFKQTLEKDAELALANLKNSLMRELPRCFGSELAQLSKGTFQDNGFNVSLEHINPKWSMNISPDENLNSDKVQVALLNETFELIKNHLARLEDYTGRGSSTLENTKISLILLAPEILDEVFEQLFLSIYRQFPSKCYYLPAARSGILQSHRLLASEIVRRAPFAGIEPLSTPRLTGAVADFIGGLLTVDSDDESDLFGIATFMEHEIARGQIYRRGAHMEYPEIHYEAYEQQFLMHQTSSMVSELAPLVLYLKHTVRSGDLLIIEEPESHLHPANQRILARAIVKMVRNGLKVMLTTHSDFFLSQLSNFVRLSELEDERAKMKYGEDDFLKAEEVGCYLFEWDDEGVGSVIRELHVDAENGIPEDEFYAVSEALYNEHVDIERARMKIE